ncbi:MAG TPA: radical SAM protein [Anaerolineales bacterium]|nr:radical SAM protein [Anaerolineales bacterium]
MTRLSGLHILLTYRCLSQCDHCFVWGGPDQSGVFALEDLYRVLDQARQVPTLRTIYFEGGEPFLYYPLLVEGVRAAADRGFSVGLVTNGYWATSIGDALVWLEPLAGMVQDLSVSTDLFHSTMADSPESRNLLAACQELDIPADTIRCAVPAEGGTAARRGAPVEGGEIMFRGRAAARLANRVPHRPWTTFEECPHEDLEDPDRVHLDPGGNLHLCQGLLMGNLFDRPLAEIVEGYQAADHPIAGPLTAGGPAELVRIYDLAHEAAYADACHLCYAARLALRARFPAYLAPDAMYGVGATA